MNKGSLATVLVHNGTLKLGDTIVVGETWGRVKAMFNDTGKRIRKAEPATPVEILGLSDVAKAGDVLTAVPDERQAKELIEKNKAEMQQHIKVASKSVSLTNLYEQVSSGQIKELNVVLKADVQGSIEPIRSSLEQLATDELKVRIIRSGSGNITESDVMLAAASSAVIIGFGILPTQKADEMHKKEKVEVRTYDVIYKLVDDIKLAFKGMLEPEVKRVDKGKAEVREIFKLPRIGVVAGSYVLEGEVERGNLVNVIRDGKVIHEGKVATLHRFKEDVKKVSSGYECGIRLEEYQDLSKGDVLEFYELK